MAYGDGRPSLTNERIDLNELGNARRWDKLIELASREVDSPMLSQWEREFVLDMMLKDQQDRPLWSPTRKQYNALHLIVHG